MEDDIRAISSTSASAGHGAEVEGVQVAIVQHEHRAKERWQSVKQAIANRDGPFKALALLEQHADKMRALHEMFKVQMAS